MFGPVHAVSPLFEVFKFRFCRHQSRHRCVKEAQLEEWALGFGVEYVESCTFVAGHVARQGQLYFGVRGCGYDPEAVAVWRQACLLQGHCRVAHIVDKCVDFAVHKWNCVCVQVGLTRSSEYAFFEGVVVSTVLCFQYDTRHEQVRWQQRRRHGELRLLDHFFHILNRGHATAGRDVYIRENNITAAFITCNRI